MKTYKIEMGFLVEVELQSHFNDREKYKHWLAVISLDPTQPGGLKRLFCERGKGGPFAYDTKELRVGLPVEWGSNLRELPGGRYGKFKGRERVYQVVIEKTDTLLSCECYPTAVQAIKATIKTVEPCCPERRNFQL